MANQSPNNVYGGFFRNIAIVGWSFDSLEEIRQIVGDAVYDQQIENYKVNFYDKGISKILFDCGIKFDLGGQTEKTRIITTDNPQGIFDFSLASKGLFRVQEFFSPDLFKEKRNIFSEYDLPLGVVPVQMINERVVGGEKKYVFTDSDGKDYYCIKQQKGTAAIAQGVQGAKLKFATKTKKVYLKFKRSGGKVNYVEIYSIFHWGSDYGQLGYALRHIPALMVCEYFESIGIKTRFYPTRYVRMKDEGNTLREKDSVTNAKLPMAEDAIISGKGLRVLSNDWIIVQPILAKEYGQEVDFLRCLAIAPRGETSIYVAIAEQAQLRDMIYDKNPFGQPKTTALNYREAFERYKNKYQIYVENGLFKGKEVTPECQILHASDSLALDGSRILSKFDNYAKHLDYQGEESQRIAELVSNNVYAKKIIEFWIRIMAFKMRDYIALLVTKEPIKEMKKIVQNAQNEVDSFMNFFRNATFKDEYEFSFVGEFLQFEVRDILRHEKMAGGWTVSTFRIKNPNPLNYPSPNWLMAHHNDVEISVPQIQGKAYIEELINEATIFADGGYFATPPEEIERLDNLVERLLDELQKADLE